MYIKKEFIIPILIGISQKNIEEHLKLYDGYVNNTNTILRLLDDTSIDVYIRDELSRRFSFEYNGMRNHEYYFSAIKEGPHPHDPSSKLGQQIIKQWGSYETWYSAFITLAKTRQIGHLNSCQYIIGIDMWEHAYVADYQPSGKTNYINDYFANINWTYIENHYINFI